MTDLSRKRDRERLKVRREAYWQRLSEGAYLGFRRGPDTWLARFRGRDKKQRWQPLGEAIEYDEAKRRAEDWLETLSGSAVRTVKRATVRAALEAYLTDLRRHGRHDTAKEIEGRFKLTVWEDPLAELELEDATSDDFLEWRDRLTEGRQPRSVQRQVRAVVAGLSRARKLGHVGNPDAWDMTPLADDVDDSGETAVYITADHRKALIAAAGPYTADFMRALDYTGARPKEIASTKVADFDGATLRLAHRKGRPAKLRVRHTVLNAEGIAFFSKLTQDRLPKAPLLTEDGKQPWRRHVWCNEIRAALEAHNKDCRPERRVPEGATAYSFRHARISELLQIHGVDPLTVAQQTGTSLAMIEKAYLRFIPAAMAEKLAAVKAAG